MVPDDEPALEPADVAALVGVRGRVLTSPARRCRVEGAVVDERLRPWDLGSWAGSELAGLDPSDLAAWRSDPGFRRHGGESLTALLERVGALLQEQHTGVDRVVAVTHAAVVKCAVVLALRAPADAVWDVDVAPGSVTELHPTSTGWRITRVGAR